MTSGEDLYTVLELLEGPDLCELLARSGPLPWRQVVDLGIEIADALDTAHRQGLIHRDVKPANIMRTAVGEAMRVKLIDFGVVRITANYRAPTGATARRPTDMGKALGTPGYLPLEAGLVMARRCHARRHRVKDAPKNASTTISPLGEINVFFLTKTGSSDNDERMHCGFWIARRGRRSLRPNACHSAPSSAAEAACGRHAASGQVSPNTAS